MSKAQLLRGRPKTVVLSNGLEVVVRPVNLQEVAEVLGSTPVAVRDPRESGVVDLKQQTEWVAAWVSLGVVEPRIIRGRPEELRDAQNEVSIYEIPQGLLQELLDAVLDVSGMKTAATFQQAEQGTAAPN